MEYLAQRAFAHRWGGNDFWWMANLMWLLLIAGLVAVAVMFALRLADRPPVGPGSTGPPSPGSDPAVDELRLRYARGELSRDDYVRRARDLGTPVPAEPPSSPPPA